MAANELIFSIVLMVNPGTFPADWKASPTISHVIAPEYKDSISCQRQALTFNKARGSIFKGMPGTKYQNVQGQIIGAWCTVHAKVKENQ